VSSRVYNANVVSKVRQGAGLMVALAFGVAPVVRGVPSGRPGMPTQTSAQPALGLVVGRVVDATNSAPIARAIVALSGSGLPTRRVIVDPQGRFMFTALPPGSFTIASTKSGYLEGAYGKLQPNGVGRPLDLREGERVTDATVKMWRSATISGTVTDDAGDPVSATVQVWRRMVNRRALAVDQHGKDGLRRRARGVPCHRASTGRLCRGHPVADEFNPLLAHGRGRCRAAGGRLGGERLPPNRPDKRHGWIRQ
jgi:hypothetical protein